MLANLTPLQLLVSGCGSSVKTLVQSVWFPGLLKCNMEAIS